MSDTAWLEDATIYTLDVKTFYDSDGDGWGDFQGLIEKLEYVDDLGVDCLWIRPFYPSPLRDNGYDVADYYAVDDRLGTLEDFREFTDRAHDRGIRVLTDLVFNHTSIDHEWFQQARRDPESKYREYYLWTDDVETAYDTFNIFPEHEDGVWSHDEVAGEHYFHQFFRHQPDLNVRNPAVREEFHDVLRFWLRQGADGFRIDAAHPMLMPKGHDGDTLENPIDLFKEMKRVVSEEQSDAILLAEADDQPEQLPYYFGDGAAFDLQFNFVMNAHLTYAIGVGDTWPLHRAHEIVPDVDGIGRWANFLRNHDEWNLLKLPEEAFYHAREAFGDDAGDSWIFERGHRLRLAEIYDNDLDRVEMAYSMLLSLPDVPVLLAGDEIGMGSDPSLREREAVRTPMQWDDSEYAGFSTSDPGEVHNPVIDEGEYSYERVNVADQLDDPESLLSQVRKLVDARNQCPEITDGTYSVVDVDGDDVWIHRFDHGDNLLVCAHNFADEKRAITCGFGPPGDVSTTIAGGGDYRVESGEITFHLDGCDYSWVRADKWGKRAPEPGEVLALSR